MEKIYNIFVDGSVNPQKKIGFGSYLFCDDINHHDTKKIKSKFFEDTSSTKLELQTFIWALKDIDLKCKFVVYTDCQNILSLLNRKEKLQSNNYKTSTNKLVKNKQLYEEFFLLCEKYDFEVIKVKGHKKSCLKDNIEKIFTFVDRYSRKKLREYLA
ncbi:ribonuclease H [Malaciobacter molluscorum]|uniref:RNase H family protein n=1 Tax=Malaciobacter molluscorum TaxID=1032072 RepID=UPI00100A6F31|nr:RNase H family protein [Malaciobacter molluscorum]RXJ97420.1 ribonuclease H [Malaciobacter molluscorum]